MADRSEVQNYLNGVRVLDFTQFEAGPACTEAFAWLGAEVVKVENPTSGDPGRSLGSPAPGKDGGWFQQFNANKKSVAINLKSAEGVEIVKSLAREADVMVENFAPGAIDRLGLGYDIIKAINPGIIYARIKGYGTGSPYEKNLSFDVVGQASGGAMSITGLPDGLPLKAGPTLADSGTGMLLAVSILAALYRRKGTGQGEHIEVAMQDSIMHYMRGAFAEQMRSGVAAHRSGTRSSSVVNIPSNIFPCKPGGPNDYVYVYTSRVNPEHWTGILKVIGREDLIGDPRFSTLPARIENETEVNTMLTQWSKGLDKHAAMRMLGEAGVPSGAVFDTSDLMAEKSFEDRGIIQEVDHPTLGPVKMETWPARFGSTTARIAAAPLLGQHNEEVLSEWLKMPRDNIERLKRDGLIRSKT